MRLAGLWRCRRAPPVNVRLLTTTSSPSAVGATPPVAAAAASKSGAGAGTGYGLSQRPRLASRVAGLLPSLYARIYGKLQHYKEEIYPFHIGETHLLPSPVVVTSLREHANDRDMHHYSHPQGLLSLRTALASYLHPQHPHLKPEHIIVTHGGTHALNLACQAVLDPGDVMLVLSPHWPLINSMVHTASAVPIEVPFYSKLRDGISSASGGGASGRVRTPAERAALVTSILRAHLHPRTRAVYLTSPNNPDGTVLCEAELGAVAQFCRDNHLYVLVDHAYERFHFPNSPANQHCATTTAAAATAAGGKPAAAAAAASRVGGCTSSSWAIFDQTMADKTIHVFTFSKSHRMAGLRVGWIATHAADVRDAMIKLANISIYNVSLLTQHAATAAVRDTEPSLVQTLEASTVGRQLLCESLAGVAGCRFTQPEGGAYVFAELSEVLNGRDCFELLDACLDRGVVFAPGSGFGHHYPTHARFCFTAMGPDQMSRGMVRLADVLTKFRKQSLGFTTHT